METRMKNLVIVSLMLALSTAFVLADTKTTTVTFVIPSSLSHTVAYGGSCDSSNFFFVDEDGTYNGHMAKINVSSDSSPNENWCQNETTSGMTLTNTGNEAVNFTAKWDSDLAGIDLVSGINYSSYGGECNGLRQYGANACTNISTTFQLIANNTAAAGTADIWWWAIMVNFNSGASTTGVTRTLTTNASAAG